MTNEQLKHLNFTEENIKLIEKWVEYLSKGAFGNSRDITNTYNEVFDGVLTKVNVTSCGSCIRNRINTLNNALKEWRAYKATENASNLHLNAATSEENASSNINVPQEVNNALETKSEDNGKRKVRKTKE